jgi:hypothetical protein
MEKTRENVLKVTSELNGSSEWSNIPIELITRIWDYVYMPEDFKEAVWIHKWMGLDTITNFDREIMKDIVFGPIFDWSDIIRSHKLPTDEQWKQMLYHFNNIK